MKLEMSLTLNKCQGCLLQLVVYLRGAASWWCNGGSAL